MTTAAAIDPAAAAADRESRIAVRDLFRAWQAALATDTRFSSLRKLP